MAKQTSAGIIIYKKTSQGTLFLLLYHGGKYWNFPKGKIEEGKEKTWETALREVKEETGLAKKNLKFHPKFKVEDKYEFRQDGTKISKNVIYFLAESNKIEIKISPREHRGFGWFNYKEAKKILVFKNLEKILEKANRMIKRKK